MLRHLLDIPVHRLYRRRQRNQRGSKTTAAAAAAATPRRLTSSSPWLHSSPTRAARWDWDTTGPIRAEEMGLVLAREDHLQGRTGLWGRSGVWKAVSREIGGDLPCGTWGVGRILLSGRLCLFVSRIKLKEKREETRYYQDVCNLV